MQGVVIQDSTFYLTFSVYNQHTRIRNMSRGYALVYKTQPCSIMGYDLRRGESDWLSYLPLSSFE